MRFDLAHDLDLKFSSSKMKFAISQPKMVSLPRNEQQACQLKFMHQMQSLGSTLAMTIKLDFQGPILKHANWHWTNQGVIHDHDRDVLVTKMRLKDLPGSDRGDFRCRCAVDSSGFRWTCKKTLKHFSYEATCTIRKMTPWITSFVDGVCSSWITHEIVNVTNSNSSWSLLKTYHKCNVDGSRLFSFWNAISEGCLCCLVWNSFKLYKSVSWDLGMM